MLDTGTFRISKGLEVDQSDSTVRVGSTSRPIEREHSHGKYLCSRSKIKSLKTFGEMVEDARSQATVSTRPATRGIPHVLEWDNWTP